MSEPRRVVIGLPWYYCEPETAFCMAQTYLRLAGDGPTLTVGQFRCSSVAHARCRLVAQFMATDCTHLLMVDGDMTWEPQAVMRLLEHDKPFVAVAGWSKRASGFHVGSPGTGDGDRVPIGYDPETGLLEVERLGACFMLIRRDCIETLIATYPKLWLEHEEIDDKLRPHYYAFFQTSAKAGRMPTEDFFFCDLLRGAGIPVLADGWIELGHVVAETKRGKLIDHIEF